MSIYSVKGKGWRYDFTLRGKRHTKSWFKTKKEAKKAEAQRNEELMNPQPIQEIPTDMVFWDLINRRLDHIKAYNSSLHYQDSVYKARHWTRKWGKLFCSEISQEMIEKFVLKRSAVSAATANKEIRYLRSLFNFGIKKKMIVSNPLDGIDFLPEEKRIKYVPPIEDIDKVVAVADPDTQDYLWVVRETMARVSEINHLVWDDVDLATRSVVLYTRKKKGGHLTPRKIPMTQRVHEILLRRYQERDRTKVWVFWHRYKSRKDDAWKEGPFLKRSKLMRNLCKKAEVKHFGFHAMRHAGATILENNNVSIGTIHKILGHENRSTTEIYLHSIGENERLAMLAYEHARQKVSHGLSHGM